MFYRRTIKDYQLGLEWHHGKLVGVRRTGVYWLTVGSGRTIQVFDTRKADLRVAGQEVMLGDRTSLKINVAGSYKLTDPVKLVKEVAPELLTDHLTQAVQLRLRDLLATKSLDDLLEHRADINTEFAALMEPEFTQLGLELGEIKVKDVILPSELRKAYTESLGSQLRAKAQLEQARGQSAALRNLANTADLMEKHPQLIQLLSLQREDSNLNIYFDQPDRREK